MTIKASRGIRVAVIYDPERKPRPIWFDLDGEKATVTEVCYFWTSHVGKALINHYSVNTDRGLYELQLNVLEQKWLLKNPENK